MFVVDQITTYLSIRGQLALFSRMLLVKISVGFSNSVCLISGLKGVNITATVGLVIHAAGTDHCYPEM